MDNANFDFFVQQWSEAECTRKPKFASPLNSDVRNHMNKPPLHFYRMSLKMKSVHIQCLDENRKVIKDANASGFIVEEKGDLFLYTCWHVVTGCNMHDVIIGKKLPDRKYIEVNLQDCDNRQPGVQVIGGNQTSILSLYDEHDFPLWIQNTKDVPNPDLNTTHLKVPFWHDVVKLALPKNISVSGMQVIKEDEVLFNN